MTKTKRASARTADGVAIPTKRKLRDVPVLGDKTPAAEARGGVDRSMPGAVMDIAGAITVTTVDTATPSEGMVIMGITAKAMTKRTTMMTIVVGHAGVPARS